MSAKFHNKYHRQSHHTDTTSGDNDSATDSIGSSENPFKGVFYMSGLLSVSGNVNLSGDLDMNNNEIIRPATTNKYGVVRIATSEEASKRIATDIVLSPKHLSELKDEITTDNPPHNLISDMHENTAYTGTLKNSQLFTYRDGYWTNETPDSIHAPLATDLEAESGVAEDVAVTPEQMLKEIRRNRPILYTGSGAPVNSLGDGIYELQTNESVGTLAFKKIDYNTVWGVGNHATTVTLTRYEVYRWNGSSWIKLY